MLANPVRRRDVFNPRYRFRDARTGKYVTRAYALLWPQYTIKERVA